MAVTREQIQARLSGLGYPCFTDEALTAIIEKSEESVSNFKPRQVFATFLTVQDSQDYFIFDTDDVATQGCCANANAILNVIWDSGGSSYSLDIFGPGYQIFNNLVTFNGSEFHRPSDMLILQQKINNFEKQFGPQMWEVIGQTGDESAFLRLYSAPREAGNHVVILMGVPYTIAEIVSLSRGNGRYFMQWLEANAARTVANALADTAGTSFGPFKDSGMGLEYWDNQAKDKERLAYATQGGTQGDAARS